MLLIRPTPTWQGMPPEIQKMIVKNLNVLDRSLLRKVSLEDKILADTLPYEIDTIEILASSNELTITIQEASSDLPIEIPISYFIAILENSNVKISNLNFSSGQNAFGQKLQEFVEIIVECEISKNFLKVKEVKFSSERYFLGKDPTHADVSDTMNIKEILEYCDSNFLDSISIGSMLDGILWEEIIKTEQWNNAEKINILEWQNDEMPRFMHWKGKHLYIRRPAKEKLKMSEMVHITTVFSSKPIGSSVKIHYKMSTGPPPLFPTIIRKYDNPSDNSKRLYVFHGFLFMHGFVRHSDGTPEGSIVCDPFNETRHLD